jgi:hypothetical protein
MMRPAEKASWMLIISVLLVAEIHSIRWDKTYADDKARSDRTAQDAAFELVLKKEDAQLQETLRGFDTVGRLARKSIGNCTYLPIAMSTSYTKYDYGNGPYIYIDFSGNNFSQIEMPATAGNYTTPAGTTHLYVPQARESGYVDVFASFGGCNYPWSFYLTHRVTVIDTTANILVFNQPATNTAWHYCGPVPSCGQWSLTNPALASFNVTAGHVYKVTEYTQASINGASQGTSVPPYSGFVTITVH